MTKEEQKQKKAAYNRLYYSNHKEMILPQKQKWYKKNKKVILTNKNDYREKNKLKIKIRRIELEEIKHQTRQYL